VLLFDELARRGDAGTGVSSVFGELGFLPLGLSDPAGAGWPSDEAMSRRGLGFGVVEAECSEEKVIGL
jgi:hypothetical protein